MHTTHNLKTKCGHTACHNIPLSQAEFCWEHLADKEHYKARLIEYIIKGEDLSGYNLQKIDLRGVNLEKAKLSKANLSQADLSGSNLFDSKLTGADLIGTSLANSDLTHCDLRGADLTKARMCNTRLWNANLKGANLTECDLAGSDFWNAQLFNTKLWHAVLKEVKSMTMENFYTDSRGLYSVARINETGLLSAKESYRDLKGLFISTGMYNDASWAAFREMTMERLLFKKKRDLKYFPSLLMNILCGYGEKPYRIIISALAAILIFAFFYAWLNAITNSASSYYILKWSDYIYYSTVTFTTVGYGDFIPKTSALFKLLAASEAFIGTFLTGLFIFTLARKYSAR